ncbi:MAG: outer membrane protein assembly factor BamE [Rubricella sp.]
MRAFGRISVIVLLAGALGACTALYDTHGYVPPEAQLEQIQIGLDTRQDVVAKVGQPVDTGLIEEDTWYYVRSVIRRESYRAPEVVEREIVAIRFDEFGTVAEIARGDLQDGREIAFESETTPTYGSRVGLLQQIAGNVFNPTAGAE